MMNKLYAVAAAMLLSIFASSSQAADVSLSMVYTNALGDDLPFSIFSGHGWAPEPKARFVKLHMYFDEPFKVKEVAVDSCGEPLKSEISMFVNFDQWIWSPDHVPFDGDWRAIKSTREGNMMVVTGMEQQEIRSLTINFEHNSGFRICAIHFKNPQGEEYTIHTPTLVPGAVTASSTLAPVNAYAAINLFDSRFEYGWASNKKAKNVDLSFDFDAPKRVERIRIWNGYQRSEVHCVANSRVKTFHITGDGGYDEQITVKDTLGSQVILLPKPFEGKHLKFAVVDSFRGKSYPDLVISELRFYDGKDWFMLDPSEKLKQSIADNRAKFAQAGVQALLNDSYANDWQVFRFRADGSFYLSYSDGPQSSVSLGNYEVKNVWKNGLRLRLFGLRSDSEEYSDCNGCGRDCNKLGVRETSDGSSQSKIFQEFLTILSDKGGKLKFVFDNWNTTVGREE